MHEKNVNSVSLGGKHHPEVFLEVAASQSRSNPLYC